MNRTPFNSFMLIFVLFGLIHAQYYGNQYYGNNDAVLLQDVRALTFNKGQTAIGRRSSVPQLKCIGGNAQSNYELQPSTVQCINVGTDGSDVQWKCEAELDSSVRFGETYVSCEGYSGPNDPYVLKGSCGLEYSLEYTGHGRQNNAHYSHNPYNTNYQHQSNFSWGNVFMFVIIAFIVMGLLKQCSQNSANIGTTYPGNDQYNNYPGSYPPGCAPTYPTYQTNYGNTWRPGFWSGVGTGGFLGYLFNRPRTYGYNQTAYGNPSYGSAPTFGRSSGWSSGGSPSAPRTASAFATTRRR